MIEINSKQRKYLEKLAHDLQPVVIVGGAGLTDGVLKMTKNSIASHELLKVKFYEYIYEKVVLTIQICEYCDANLIRIIGNIAILYKPAEKEDDRKIFLD